MPAGLIHALHLINGPRALVAIAADVTLAPGPRLQRGELFTALFARVLLAICTCRGGAGLSDGGIAQRCTTMASNGLKCVSCQTSQRTGPSTTYGYEHGPQEFRKPGQPRAGQARDA